jgi:recombination DNA repair RAD52 pathway protein
MYHNKSKNSFNEMYSKNKKIFLTDNLEKILKENYLKSKAGNTQSTIDYTHTAESMRRLDNDLD